MNVNITTREARNTDAAAWDAFLSGNPAGSLYHLYRWRELVEREFGHRTDYRIATQGDLIEGVLPLVLVSSRLFGRILCSVPFMNYGGPCATSPLVSELLVRDAMRRADKLGADYLELRCTAALNVDLPVSLRKISMTIALDPDPDQLWNSYASKHRKNVKRAYKNDLEVRVGGSELLVDFCAVLERSWRDLGTPFYHRGYFRAVLEAFPDRIRLYVCQHQGRPVSVALVGLFGGTAEGLWQGGLPQARDLDANYVLYWEMIRDLCLRDCHEFHLGRSTADSGGEWFKSRWNADTRQLYWYFHRPDGGPVPALNVDNPRYRPAIAAWRRLPLWLTRLLGPPLARSIP